MTPFATALLRWYAREARSLPWRGKVDPYQTLLSEVMLQQTRAETVIPYFNRWLRRLPTIESLAAASERTVLSLWEGLGYYARARNLHQAARVIAYDYKGQIPRDAEALRLLPGIGEYTAGAIASIAFGRDVPAIDGNARRVLARVFGVDEPLGSTAAEQRFRRLCREHLPHGRAGNFNQALMDLGATVCLPRQPKCENCPVRNTCYAKAQRRQLMLPRRKTGRPVPHVVIAAAVVLRSNQVLITQRGAEGLLARLWQFPHATMGTGAAGARCLRARLPAALRQTVGLRIWSPTPAGVIHHAYSHLRVTVHTFYCRGHIGSDPRGYRWVPVKRLSAYPMGKVDRVIATELRRSERMPD